MSEIKTYMCDVKRCGLQLGQTSGSAIRIEVKKPVGWGAPAVGTPDLCDIHLAEFWKWFDERGIKLDVDV